MQGVGVEEHEVAVHHLVLQVRSELAETVADLGADRHLANGHDRQF